MSSMSPARGLELTEMSHASPCGGPGRKAQRPVVKARNGRRICATRLRNLYWNQEVMLTAKIRAPWKAAAILRDSEALTSSSSSNKTAKFTSGKTAKVSFS
ncbi:hypothetical protein H920_08914 [Fukomys damarensis]|uniref:Uncharacterized protein n=1 Tax=Fukomys damarensis TaxID=885580 RepID=A0A091DCB9_FUKDA|nr:hypothetical protein H920_08914 [Fukomys damarensis]